MHIGKGILSYIIWFVTAFLLAFIYVRIILGAKPESSSFLMRLFGYIYDFVFLKIGIMIGSIVSFIFMVIDFFYLKRKLINGIKSTISRLFVLVLISLIVGTIHYVLKKVIDFKY